MHPHWQELQHLSFVSAHFINYNEQRVDSQEKCMPNTSLRNVVLLSHSGAGKTVLAEAMLHVAGVTTRLGRTEDGTTASDFEEEEIRRQTSVQLSLLRCPWKNYEINIIDTPGYADYRGEVISGARVADGAVIVVDATSGVEVGTHQMWQLANELKLPRIIFINKMNRDNADFRRVMDSLIDKLGRQCVALQIPIGAEANFSGNVNVRDIAAKVPEEVQELVEAARERLTEAIVETDDDLTMKYLEGEEISNAEFAEALRNGVTSNKIVPVLLGSATNQVGAKELLDIIIDLIPSPNDVKPVTVTNTSNDDAVTLSTNGTGPLAALIFKTSADPFVGKLSYLRVYDGILKSDSQLWNANHGESERVGQVYTITGKSQKAVSELLTGDIDAVAKLSSTLTSDTLSERDNPLLLTGIEFPNPVYNRAVYPKSSADLDKMTSTLARIGEEDPSLTISREPNTLELLLGGLGDSHLEVAVEKTKRKFGVEIVLEEPKVPYKETIKSVAKVEYRHKKQSGGHGQFGHVWLEIQPLPRGTDFEFEQKVVGGSVPREYIPSVEKGVRSALSNGVLAGYPIVDLKVTLVDGSFHPVDSSGICFEIAGSHALAKGVQEAHPSLLEPIMQVTVTVPDNYTGDLIGDLNSKRAKILSMTPQGNGITLIEVEAPQAEMLRYATTLRSQTQGRGSFKIEFDHYEEVPAHLVERVVDELKQREESRS